ncbi:MAG TPA: enoyl-CoA hydratase/isomerase family protein [Candidatus Competibacteraceae bacterium]|nr:enoyl-CoA hydratase/isomerase family protein [Candidatus Competibacteraceae bacterium]
MSILSQTEKGIATLTLNRPELHNAFDDALITELTLELQRLDADPAVRAVVLAAAGRSFSAGADLNWMKRMAGYSFEQNLDDARALAKLMYTLDTLAKPTVARVQGAAFGGGVGLVACCDIAIAADSASFCLSEVRLGLIPAVISPYVVRAIGERQARRYFVSAERFDAREALRIGLVHQVVAPVELDGAVADLLDTLLGNGPAAMVEAKRLAQFVARTPFGAEQIADTARRIAERRASAEGREGIAAFLEKRKPAWTED